MIKLPRFRRIQLGADYDTTWARKPLARAVRKWMVRMITLPMIKTLATPTVVGTDRLDRLQGPAVFVANHSSHADTSVMLTSLPPRIRNQIVVAARAEYFFNTFWKAFFWTIWINVIPIERSKASRRSILLAQSVIEEGWNLLIYPEETRGDDDYTLPFKPGAAYLAIRAGVPVVPVHIEGTRRIYTPYSHRFRPGRTRVVIGEPMWPQEGEKAQAFNERVEQAVFRCADEGRTDWWSAQQRAAAGLTPSLRAPDNVEGWRRSWTSSKSETNKVEQTWPM